MTTSHLELFLVKSEVRRKTAVEESQVSSKGMEKMLAWLERELEKRVTLQIGSGNGDSDANGDGKAGNGNVSGGENRNRSEQAYGGNDDDEETEEEELIGWVE